MSRRGAKAGRWKRLGRRVTLGGGALAIVLLVASPATSAARPPFGTIFNLAGSTAGYSGDGGTATSAQLASPTSVATDPEGNLVIFDDGYDSSGGGYSSVIRVMAVSSANPGYHLSTGCPMSCTTSGVTWTRGDVYTIGGTGAEGYSGDGGPATSATLAVDDYSGSVTVDAHGNVVFSDNENSAVRIIAVSATNPGYPLSTGCPASCTATSTWTPGDMYTIAGTGTTGYTGDGGPSTSAKISEPAGLAVDHKGNLLFTDQFSQEMRVIAVSSSNPGYVLPSVCPAAETSCAGTSALRTWTKGHIYTIVGGGNGFSGDGGPATTAKMEGEYQAGLSVDAHGNIVFADSGDNVIRVVAVSTSNPGYPLPTSCRASETSCGASLHTWTKGDIYSIAGTGSTGYSGDGGPAKLASLHLGYGGSSALDVHGNIVIGDNVSNVLRVVAVSSINPGYVLPTTCPTAESACGNSLNTWRPGDIYTFAGDGTYGSSGDNGPALSAEIAPDYGGGMAFDTRGDVYYADSGSNVVREITVTATEPSAPLNLKATASAGKVALSWAQPAGSGGPAVLGYSAYKATRSGGENYAGAAACTSKGAATTHCTVTGLTDGKTYWFTVKARNVVAMGPPSNQASAKP